MQMGIKNYFNQLKHYANIQSLDMNEPLYINTSVSHQNSSTDISSIKKYTNTDVSLGNHDNPVQQYEKKNVYANISKVSIDTANEEKRSLSTTPSFKTISGENLSSFDENNDSRMYENVEIRPKSSSSSHLYINLKPDKDKSIVIPTCTVSLTQVNPTEDLSLSSIRLIEIKQVNIETNVLEKSTKLSKAKQTLKKSEVNMTPNCHDKSNLYRSKIPSTITRILPTLRQRRTLHRPRRYRQRSSTHIRTNNNSNLTRRQQIKSMNTNHQRKSVSNQLYNEIRPILSTDNQSLKSIYTEKRFESPIQFHGISQHEILSWYPTDDEFIPDHEESIDEDDLKNADEEKFYTHKTFEDFLLRRRPKSSCSTSATVTNPLLSEPIPSSTDSHLAGITLSLDKKDVDFIHDIIQRTQGDQRVTNRITALREAYIRAINKRKDLLRTKQFSHLNEKKIQRKKPLITSKIRDELEKYDQLPVYQRTSFDEDEDEETYSINDQHRYYYHHRRLPPLPSTRDRFISFVTTLKRQLQKNFQEIRSRILIELMANPSRHEAPSHCSSGLSHRHKSHLKSSRHHSVEHSYPFDRNQSSRTHHSHSYNHFSHRPRTFRVTPDLPQRQKFK